MKKFLAMYMPFCNHGFGNFTDDNVFGVEKEEIEAESMDDARTKAEATQVDLPSGGRRLLDIVECSNHKE